MNILLINPFSQVAAVRQKNIARRLAKRGHVVTLMLPLFDQYSQYKKERLTDEWGIKSINPRQFDSKRLEISFLLYIPSAIIKTLGIKIDVVHAFRPTPFSGLIGYLISKIKRVPFVLEHGDIEWETMSELKTHPRYRISIVRFLERFLTRRADAITVMNTNVKEYVMKNYSPKAPVCLVTNGVDTKNFSPDRKSRRKELQKRLDTRKLIMFHGKLDNIEHIKALIDVMRLLPPMYGLVIIGWGKGLETLKLLAKKNNVLEKILFIGRVDHDILAEYLNSADILIAPFAKTKGVEHASNLKVFEYMAMGKPLVVSKVGDLPQVLKDSAIFYEPEDIIQLSEKIQSVKIKVNESARLLALEHDWDKKAEQLEAVYERAMR